MGGVDEPVREHIVMQHHSFSLLALWCVKSAFIQLDNQRNDAIAMQGTLVTGPWNRQGETRYWRLGILWNLRLDLNQERNGLRPFTWNLERSCSAKVMQPHSSRVSKKTAKTKWKGGGKKKKKGIRDKEEMGEGWNRTGMYLWVERRRLDGRARYGGKRATRSRREEGCWSKRHRARNTEVSREIWRGDKVTKNKGKK